MKLAERFRQVAGGKIFDVAKKNNCRNRQMTERTGGRHSRTQTRSIGFRKLARQNTVGCLTVTRRLLVVRFD